MKHFHPASRRECKKHQHVILYCRRVPSPLEMTPDIYNKVVLCRLCGALMLHPDHLRTATPADEQV